MCELYILFDSDSNPFRRLLSYALDDVTLKKAIVALAARHFANSGQHFDPTNADISPRFAAAKLEALHFKNQTIKALTWSLPRNTFNKDATMATILLLIFLDLLESGLDGWNFHIQGAKVLSLADQGSDTKADIDRGETARKMRRFIVRQLSLCVGICFHSVALYH